MLGIKALLLGVCLAAGGPSGQGAIAPGEFRGWFEQGCRGRLHIDRAQERRARLYRYVFVGGFWNENTPGYFRQDCAALRGMGVPRVQIYQVHPSSRGTVDENAEGVRDAFLRIAAEGPEKLVIIAHSRGACDALAFALKDPEFVRDRVEALFLVQGAFGGSGLADYIVGDGEPIDRRMPPVHRLLARLIARFERSLWLRGDHAGLPGLTRAASRSYWKGMLEEHADAIPVVGPKTFYIQSQTRPSRLRLFRRATAWYLRTYYGPNDGIVERDDQTLPGLGTSLGTLDVGHGDLTGKFPTTRAGRKFRKAFMRCIVLAVERNASAAPSPQE